MKLNPNFHLLSSKEREQTTPRATRDGFGEGLLEAGRQNPKVVALTADLMESTRVQAFAETFPDRFFDVGVAEQNLMGVAAGLALSGKVPFVASYAAFSPGRSWDQLRVSICYSQANVKVVGGHTGLSVGPDGATHQALEDLALTRVLPNLTVIVPVDAVQARLATLAVASHPGPVYLRTSRDVSPLITTHQTPFKIGEAQVFAEGSDVTIVSCGPVLSQALLAAEDLAEKGISVELINLHTLKPLDQKTLLKSFAKTGAVVTVEEHQVTNGLGATIAELTAQHLPTPQEMVGVKDSFGESGKTLELWQKYGLTAESITTAVHQVLRRKKN
jgi:transketolase